MHIALVLCALMRSGIAPANSAFAAPTPGPTEKQSGEVTVRQLDVGQGDATLITTPEGKHVLIDAGPNANLVAGMLIRDKIDTLDLVVASHNHADHIGGMSAVFSRIVVRAYLDNDIPQTTSTYRRTLLSLEREPGLKYLKATARTITVGTVQF